jgi:hypothetical protein
MMEMDYRRPTAPVELQEDADARSIRGIQKR